MIILIGYATGNAGLTNPVGDDVELFVGGFLEFVGGRLTVDGVNHHLAGLDELEGAEPGKHVGVIDVADGVALVFALHKQGLNDTVLAESDEAVDDGLNVVARMGTVNPLDVVGLNGVEFADVVIHTAQGIEHGRTHDLSGVGEDTDFGVGEILIAQADGVVDDFGEMRMQGGLAIARKGEDIGFQTLLLHLGKLCLQSLGHFFAGGLLLFGSVVLVESTFTVDAVEGTHFAVGRKQVDA